MDRNNDFRDESHNGHDKTDDIKNDSINERTDMNDELGEIFKENQEEVQKEAEEGQKDPEEEVEGRSQGSQEDLQAHEKEAEENTEENEKESAQNGQTDQEALLSDESVEQTKQYSCSYAPPAYIPNFTVVESQAAIGADTEKKAADEPAKSGRSLLFPMVFSAAIAVIVGVLCGFFVATMWEEGRFGSLYRPDATVTKNNGSIEVNEIVGSTGYDHLSVEEVAALVSESVVEITTSQVQYDSFFGNYATGGAGSGVIISEEGYIITNHHVVENATDIIVTLSSGKSYKADLIGSDASYDVAVLRIEAEGLKAAVLGKSSELKVGQGVVAIGNPLGSLGGTVTDGIVSALDRWVSVDGYPMLLLQTNAAINHGNSGGGLFNMAGELIGIVNAKMSDAETGIEGLGFAIPIDIAWDKASDLMKYGYVTGEPILDFEVAAMKGNSMIPSGVYVTASSNGEIKVNDRIVSMNGYEIDSINDFYSVIYLLQKGDTLKIVVSRMVSYMPLEYSEHTVTLTVRVTEPNN